MPSSLPDRVLIIRLGAIGDVANALLVASAIKESRPDVQVGWAVHDLAEPLVRGHPDVDKVHVWRRGRGMDEFSSFLQGVRNEEYGLAIDMQRILKSSLIARLSRAERVLGFDRARAKEVSWLWTRERIPAGRPDAHMVLQYLEFVKYLGLPLLSPVHRFPEDPEAEAWAEALIEELGRPPIVINLGASKAPNRWVAARFGELSQRILEELEIPVLLTGGPGDAVMAKEAWAALGDTSGARNLVGGTSLLQLIELLRRTRVAVSCDTGPMHLAAAVQTPVVALFGPADPGRTGPWGDQHRVVRAPGVDGSMAENRRRPRVQRPSRLPAGAAVVRRFSSELPTQWFAGSGSSWSDRVLAKLGAMTPPLDRDELRTFVDGLWDASIVPELVEYIKIPNKSPAYDADWAEHGYMEQAVEQIAAWCSAREIPGLTLEIVRLEGRTPVIYMEVPAQGAQSDDTVLLYGHFDKATGDDRVARGSGSLESRNRRRPPVWARWCRRWVLGLCIAHRDRGAGSPGRAVFTLRRSDRGLRGERQLRSALLHRSSGGPHRNAEPRRLPRFRRRRL